MSANGIHLDDLTPQQFAEFQVQSHGMQANFVRQFLASKTHQGGFPAQEVNTQQSLDYILSNDNMPGQDVIPAEMGLEKQASVDHNNERFVLLLYQQILKGFAYAN